MNSEKNIIDKLNAGNSKALKEFFLEFYPSLCIVARKYVTESDVAEDIAQESFLVYWENKKQFDSIDTLKGFLYKTTKNKCLNHLKLKGIRNNILKNDFNREELFHEFLLEEETYRIINKAVEFLPPQSRRIIELSMRGYKNPEIAEELEVSVNTIKTLKGNAYKTLRKNLKDHVFILFVLNQILNL
jgi:RNA polymerase sigma-70 factor (ECF subfamily)